MATAGVEKCEFIACTRLWGQRKRCIVAYEDLTHDDREVVGLKVIVT